MVRGPDGVCRECKYLTRVGNRPACAKGVDIRGNVTPCIYRMRCANKFSPCPHEDEVVRRAWAAAETVNLASCGGAAAQGAKMKQVGRVTVKTFEA